MSTQSFAGLGLSETLLSAVAAQGYKEPTPIQTQTIPMLLSGKDLLGTAQTGTGKTAAFVLPLLQRLASGQAGTGTTPSKKRGPARPEALILAPTRELAIQIGDSIRDYGAGSGIRHTVVFGGASKNTQLTELRRHPRILVATPGRLLDFIGEGNIDLSQVDVLLIDEADRMLDMGFIPDIRRIASRTEQRRQTVLFSATMPPEIEALSEELLGKAERVAIAPKEVTVDRIRQSVMHVAKEDKRTLLPELIKDHGMFRVLVFTRTKHRAARVAKMLGKEGIPSAEIHGNRTQNQRQSALERFRSGKVQALVATDVAARGIDVDDITHVINFEIPHEPETYVHRIGRTARAGLDGEAISLCDTEELRDFRQIESLLKQSVAVNRDHDYHVEPPRSQPKQSSKGGRSQAGGSRNNGGRNSGGQPRNDRPGNGRGGRSGGERSPGGRQGGHPRAAKQGAGQQRRSGRR